MCSAAPGSSARITQRITCPTLLRDDTNGAEHFHIHGVTGPDEYTAIVDNNTFTNLMAKSNLAYAADVVERMRAEGHEIGNHLA